MKIRVTFLVAVVLVAPPIFAADLDQQTLKAWDQHIQTKDAEVRQDLAGNSPFLWIDGVPSGRARVRQGEVLAAPAQKDSPIKVPRGLIHDWVGCIFIPKTTIQGLNAVINDYAQYYKFYNPTVVNAKLLEGFGKKQTFAMELVQRESFVTAAIESKFISQTIQLDEHREYTIISSTRIQQIENYGRSGERMLPPDQGTGFVWRLYAILRFEQRDGGVYVECEAIVLSRDIPFELEWLVKPILQHLPRNSMEALLCKTRDAVNTRDTLAVQAKTDTRRINQGNDYHDGKTQANNLREHPVQESSVGP